MTGAGLKPGPRSKDVEEALKRLGLVEEEALNKPEGRAGAEHMHRLAEAGRGTAERMPAP
ncbi:hypothetical protein B7L68_05865 [Thermoproteus sp. CP80]|jgi:hypothetical protein|uniref:hypothetical protein n=1 Tax=Thermoproteus sp. CP80 TaxID=1650659 RepID=UPI0009BF5984|nr:hypothetical protein [Thermoproteus sp. CP80]PLC63985.1 hypothetical protein B7L68_05865 [Thermoproteus sp. CP80]